MLGESTSQLGLQSRTCNTLEANGILTIADLLQCCYRSSAECAEDCVCIRLFGETQPPRKRLLDFSNFGAKTRAEVMNGLAKHGFIAAKRQGRS